MLRIRVSFTGLTGSPWLATHYFADDLTQAQADAANAAVGTFWGSIDNIMATQVAWATDGSAAVLSLAGVQTGSWAVTPVAGTGGLAVDPLPIVSQALVRWRTGAFVGGREIRGRTFVPGLTESACTLGALAAASRTVIQNAAAALIADGATVLDVWSRKNSTAVAVATGDTWTQFASMRSRRD